MDEREREDQFVSYPRENQMIPYRRVELTLRTLFFVFGSMKTVPSALGIVKQSG